MRKFFSKFCLDVLPSAFATFIAGVLLTSYHHFFLPNTPAISPRTGIEIGGPAPAAAKASQVIDSGHAAIAETAASAAKPAEAKPAAAPAPEPKVAEPAKPEPASAAPTATPRKRSQDIKAARLPEVKPEKSPTGDWQNAAERAIARSPAGAPPRPLAAPPPPLVTEPPMMQSLPYPAASAGPPAPAVPQPFSVNELNEKLEGRRVQAPPPPPAPPEPGLGERILGSMFGKGTVPESTN